MTLPLLCAFPWPESNTLQRISAARGRIVPLRQIVAVPVAMALRSMPERR